MHYIVTGFVVNKIIKLFSGVVSIMLLFLCISWGTCPFLKFSVKGMSSIVHLKF